MTGADRQGGQESFAGERCMEEGSCRKDRILLADTTVLADEALFEKGLSWITKERRDEIARLKSPDDKRRSLGAGLLLELGLREYGYTLLKQLPGKTTVSVDKGAFGKPYLSGQELFFNLSHAGAYAAAAFADCAVGIDIESGRRVRSGVAQRFFSKEECEAFLSGQHDFFWFWTRKESYIKAVGEGMHLPLTDFSVLSDKVLEPHSLFLRTWEEAEGLFLSVCAQKPFAVEPVWVDLGRSGEKYLTVSAEITIIKGCRGMVE